jgi:hypothetical protein
MAGNVTHMGEKKNVHKTSLAKPEGKRLLWRLGIDGRIILKYILKKYMRMRTRLI